MGMRISGTGSALPDQRLTNEQLEKMVETSNEWIVERTGISERRISNGETTSQLAAKACMAALASAGKKPADVDVILVATCSQDEFFPCTACKIQALIGAGQAAGFDINAACTGFLTALGVADAYLSSGRFQNALVVGCENLSHLVDYTDRGSCILFGDGAGAVFVEKSDQGGILGFMQGCDGAMGDVLSCRSDGEDKIRMDGREVYRFAVRTVPICISIALEKASLEASDIDLYLLHQANLRILESIAGRLGVPMEKVPHNLEKYGNMSSASIPVLLDEIVKCGKIKKGQKIVMAGFGAGLTYGACVLEWN